MNPGCSTASSTGGADEVKLSELDNEFYRHLGSIKDCIFRNGWWIAGLYRTRPDKVKGRWIASEPSCSARSSASAAASAPQGST